MTLTTEQIEALLPAAREAILATQSASPAMLQRVLKHKGAANGDGSYSAELIGYVEIADR